MVYSMWRGKSLGVDMLTLCSVGCRVLVVSEKC